MEKAIRTQVDGLNEVYSWETGLDCSDLPDTTRQEFKDETDVNKVLARYGINTQVREPQYQQIDYDMDLQRSLETIREAEEAVGKLPEPLRRKYSTWERFLDGAKNGEFKEDLATYYEIQAEEKAAADKAALDKANPPA